MRQLPDDYTRTEELLAQRPAARSDLTSPKSLEEVSGGSAPPRAADPYDPGEVLWQAARGQDGSERIRLSRKSYLGRTFLDLRIEWRVADGSWRPTKKGVSIRLGELADVKDALEKALDVMAKGEGR